MASRRTVGEACRSKRWEDDLHEGRHCDELKLNWWDNCRQKVSIASRNGFCAKAGLLTHAGDIKSGWSRSWDGLSAVKGVKNAGSERKKQQTTGIKSSKAGCDRKGRLSAKRRWVVDET